MRRSLTCHAVGACDISRRMQTFFTADSHFDHSAIIRLCERPFCSVDEMNAALVKNWNAVVQPDDRVFHLGDFCFKGSKPAARILEQLSGRITFIRGNHDSANTGKLERWEGCHDLLELKLDGVKIVLCHYPLLEWPGAWRGALHLHGHTHGRIGPNARRCDVGVDVWNYRPVTLRQIQERLELAPPYDPTDAHDQVAAK